MIREVLSVNGKMKKIIGIPMYLLGMLIIAVGINVAKLSGLGISPGTSIPYVLSTVIDKISLGSMTMIVYILIVFVQILVLRKKFKPINFLGIPVAVLFGMMIDFVGVGNQISIIGIKICDFNCLMSGFQAPEGYIMKLVYLIVSVLIIGLGVFLYVAPGLVPMPVEGLAGAISEVTGKSFGNSKTIVDVSMTIIALAVQLIFLGGFSSFVGENAAVREGTIISAVCIGQVAKLLGKIFRKKSEKNTK